MGANGDGRRRPPPPSAAVSVRVGTTTDAAAAAGLHAGQISEGFLSRLGPRFLTRLYRRITTSPNSFLLIAEDAGTTVGFIAGSTDVSALYRTFLWRDGVAAAILAGPQLITRWRQVVETLRHGTSGGTGAGRGAELLAVAVDRDRRNRGAGWELVTSFLAEVSSRGETAAHVVVGADNERAVTIYRRAGFEAVERFELHSGTTSLLMQWDRLDPPPDPSPAEAARP